MNGPIESTPTISPFGGKYDLRTLAGRLNALREEAGDTKSAMAAKGRITLPTILDMLSGKSKGMNAGTACYLAGAYRVEIPWLILGKGPMRRSTEKSTEVPQPVEEQSQVATIPFVPPELVPAYCSKTERHVHAEELQQKITHFFKPLEFMDADFCTVATGDAMAPEIPQGAIIFVKQIESDQDLKNVVLAVRANRLIIRKYVGDGIESFYVATNKAWPGKRIFSDDDEFHVFPLGIVLGVCRRIQII